MLHIRILTPTQLLMDADVVSVTIPGTKGSFTILDRHAPIISSMEKGILTCKMSDGEKQFQVNSGFVEMKNGVISICLE